MHSFDSWVIFHCVYIPQLSYTFVCQWLQIQTLCFCKLLACRIALFRSQCCEAEQKGGNQREQRRRYLKQGVSWRSSVKSDINDLVWDEVKFMLCTWQEKTSKPVGVVFKFQIAICQCGQRDKHSSAILSSLEFHREEKENFLWW